MPEPLFDMPQPGQPASVIAAGALDILAKIAAYGLHDSHRAELRAYVKAGREALAIVAGDTVHLECGGGRAGGFFPTACGRDYVHASHPVGRPPVADCTQPIRGACETGCRLQHVHYRQPVQGMQPVWPQDRAVDIAYGDTTPNPPEVGHA